MCRLHCRTGLGGDGVGPIYSNWDSAATTACVCYAGYFGADCSQSMCPKADDPVTTGQNYRRVMVNVGSQGTSLTGTVSITFNGYTTSFTCVCRNDPGRGSDETPPPVASC